MEHENGRNEKRVQDFGKKNLKGNDHMEDVAVVRRVILKCTLKE